MYYVRRFAGIVVLGFAISLNAYPVYAQGARKDEGHCALDQKTVLACWNFEAGKDMPKNFNEYPEFLPFLEGWDFRINLPHVRFQLARPDHGSGSIMVGVLEDTTDLYDGLQTLDPRPKDYGHRNNSIWTFRTEKDGQVHFKVLPSRRDLKGSRAENIRSLTSGWVRVGGSKAPTMKVEKPAVAVIGEGLGSTAIYLVARGEDNALYFTKRPISSTDASSWVEPWSPMGISSSVQPALAAAFNGKLALATWSGVSTSRMEVRLYDPAFNTWSPAVSAGLAAPHRPQLVWDGTALNLFFILNFRLQHVFALSDTPLNFQDRVEVSSSLVVFNDNYHVIPFNNRLHVVFRRRRDNPPPHQVWYTTSTTPYGERSRWSIPSYVGFDSSRSPKIASLYENLFVIGVGKDGRVVYSRKDPNQPGNDLTRKEFADNWLDRGKDIDRTIPGSFFDLDALSFNSDLYFTAGKAPSGGSLRGTYVINFGRAAMKQLLTEKWGMQLLWGGPGGRRVKGAGGFANGEEIPGIGDFNRDGRDDLIKFTQKAESGIGPAPVYVSINNNGESFRDNEIWHNFFSLKGEIPMVGDFNGDGFDDIITFTQKEQKDASGKVIGPAVVWVSLNEPDPDNPTRRRFGSSRVWHRFFSLKGEIPMVGDFNGDGFDDIITFTQKEQKDASGKVIGPAVVWVSLNEPDPDNPTRRRFGSSRVWHRFFSLKGEIPMVGDFNGDGKHDIVTFVQKTQHFSDGTLLGKAPVWVSLSSGTMFESSRVWHTFFSLKGEIPQVGDFNMDGMDDIATFLVGKGAPGRERNIYVAFSQENKFSRSSTWHSDFVGPNQTRLSNDSLVRSPVIGRFRGVTLDEITSLLADADKYLPDIFAFRNDGAVHVATSMGNVPYPSGAPWEHYKWFTEKAIGVTQFPEWIWKDGPKHCLGFNHRFALQGSSGVGGATLTTSSVRLGGRAGHVLQEFAHSLFANCFRKDKDPFKLFESIFEESVKDGGIEANNMPGCPDENGFYVCRPDSPEEHYFLGLLERYRLNGDRFRAEIDEESDAERREQLTGQYNWFTRKWFNNLEFKRGPSVNASLTQDGVQCLPDECQ